MLTVSGITKRYPGVTALENVDFSIEAGEVIGLIGENGAGKSTLIKTLGGLTQPDEGTITVDGKPIKISSAAVATLLGIGVIHQELNDLDNLDVAGNVMLGREPRKLGLVDRKTLRAQAIAALSRLGIERLVDTAQGELSIGERQMVEIAKALSQNARLLIMDEPTSSLTAGETEKLLKVVAELRSQNVAVIYVSHRLNEVKAIADRVVGLRDGKNAGGLTKSEITTDAMCRMMVGRDVTRPPAREFTPGPVRLKVDGLKTNRFPNYEVSFEIRAGEIVGMAGLVGSGRTEVVRTVCGMDKRQGGNVELDGKSIPASVGAAISGGLYLAPEDRRKEGLLTTMSVRENTTLPSVKRYAKGGLISSKAEAVVTEQMKDHLRIKTPTIDAEVRGLSGGNQQKVVLAKWLSMAPKVLVFDEPTRGIDIGARAEIYARMRELADSGVAILMVSSDMEEVLGMSDRVLVMHEGRLTGELSRADASEESIMAMAVGHRA